MTELVSPSSFFANPARTPSLAFWLRALLGIERGPTVPGSRVAIDATQYTPSGAGFRPAEQPASGQITLPKIASRRVRSQSGLYRSVTAERERSQCHTERHLWTNHERPAHYRHGSQSRHAWRIIQLALKFLFLRLRSRESGLVEGDNFDVAGSPEDFNRYCVFMATKSQVYACFSDFQITDADMG